jgi:multiple sugar transport system ATP-binding protein
VAEGVPLAIGIPAERCNLFHADGRACRRLHPEPGV